MVAAGLIALGALGFFAAYAAYRDVFSPVGIFCAIWFIPLGISQFYLSGLQERFDGFTWLVVLGSAAAFIFGCFMAALFSVRVPRGRSNPVVEEHIAPGRFLFAVTMLFLAAIAGYLYEAYLAGGIPLFAEERLMAYAYFAQSYVHYLTTSTIAVAILIVAYVRRFKGRHLVLAAILFLGSLFILFSLLSRLQIFLILFAGVTIVNFTARRRLGLRALVLVLIVLIVLMNAVAALRSSGGYAHAEEIGEVDFPSWAESMVWPYLYVSLNFEKLRWLIHSDQPQTYGTLSFLPVLSLTFTRRFITTAQPREVEYTLGWFNTMTYLWFPFSDFRMPGVFGLPFLYGAFSTWVYHRARRYPRLFMVCLYGLVLFTVTFMFFYNFFAFPLLWILAIQMWLVCWFARVRAPRRVRRVKAVPGVAAGSLQAAVTVPGSEART